jgi:putative aldouronate transport system substrate-binding protein
VTKTLKKEKKQKNDLHPMIICIRSQDKLLEGMTKIIKNGEKNMKKTIYILLALAMSLSLFGCKGTQANPTAAPATQAPAAATQAPAAATATQAPAATTVPAGTIQNLSFTWYKNYDWYAAEKWADSNDGEKWIKDKYGVNITYMDAGGAASTKLATMMVDNKYPDVISLDRDQTLQQMIDASALVPLDEYIQGSYLQKYLGDKMIDMFRAKDGHLYVYPNWASPIGTAGGNAAWIVQDKWYKQVGSPELKTYDDLYNYLTAVKAKFPNVTPLQVGVNLDALGVLYAGFNEANNPGYMYSYVYRNGDKLGGILSDPSYQQALLFINKLYREKLVTQDMFTMTTDDFNQRMATGNYGIALINDVFSSDWTASFIEKQKTDPELSTTVIDPLVNTGVTLANVKTNWGSAMGWNVATISKDAKNPKDIFAYFDYIFGPMGSLLTTYGAPGANGYWQEQLGPDDMPTMNPSYMTATTAEIDAKWMGSNWTANTGYMNQLTYYQAKTTGHVTQIVKDQLAHTWNHFIDATELYNVIPDPTTDIGILYKNIMNMYTTALPEIVTANSEDVAKAAIADNIAKLDAAGLQKLLDWQTAVWQKNMQTLGK